MSVMFFAPQDLIWLEHRLSQHLPLEAGWGAAWAGFNRAAHQHEYQGRYDHVPLLRPAAPLWDPEDHGLSTLVSDLRALHHNVHSLCRAHAPPSALEALKALRAQVALLALHAQHAVTLEVTVVTFTPDAVHVALRDGCSARRTAPHPQLAAGLIRWDSVLAALPFAERHGAFRTTNLECL